MARQLALRLSGACLWHTSAVKPWNGGFVYGSLNPSIDSSSLGTLGSFRFFTNTPKVKIKLRKCRPLDAVAGEEKELAPIIKIRDAILKYKRGSVPLRVLIMKRRDFQLKMSNEKLEILMKRYPNIFVFFVHPDDKQQWCRLSPQVLELLKEEQQIYAEQEALVVEKLKRLLMLSATCQIPVRKLQMAARLYGVPDDFTTSVVPKYPHFFRLEGDDRCSQILELVAWDESLAVTEFEKKAKEEAKEKGLGDIETRRRPLAFKLQYSRGMILRKREIARIDQMQRLPFISPYEKTDWVEEGTPLFDRMMVARLHELVSLTVEKKLYIHVIKQFKEEFNLPDKVAKAFNRFPGVFYITLKGAVCSVFLREGYDRRQLLAHNPVISLKAKYHKLLEDGPRLKSMMCKTKSLVQSPRAVLMHHKSLVQSGLAYLKGGRNVSVDEQPSSDGEDSADEASLSDSDDGST